MGILTPRRALRNISVYAILYGCKEELPVYISETVSAETGKGRVGEQNLVSLHLENVTECNGTTNSSFGV